MVSIRAGTSQAVADAIFAGPEYYFAGRCADLGGRAELLKAVAGYRPWSGLREFSAVRAGKMGSYYLFGCICGPFADSLHFFETICACLYRAGGGGGSLSLSKISVRQPLSLMAFMMLWLGSKMVALFDAVAGAGAGFSGGVITSQRINRIKRLLNPESIPYQARQSLIAITTGGLWGKGLGRGVLKYGHLPERYN